MIPSVAKIIFFSNKSGSWIRVAASALIPGYRDTSEHHENPLIIISMRHYYNLITMESIDVLPPEKIAFIAYNIGVYESVQKFGRLITSGKITNGTHVSKIAELLLESSAFYDAEMISSLINTMLHYTRNSIIESITAAQVVYVMSQLKASGVSLP